MIPCKTPLWYRRALSPSHVVLTVVSDVCDCIREPQEPHRIILGGLVNMIHPARTPFAPTTHVNIKGDQKAAWATRCRKARGMSSTLLRIHPRGTLLSSISMAIKTALDYLWKRGRMKKKRKGKIHFQILIKMRTAEIAISNLMGGDNNSGGHLCNSVTLFLSLCLPQSLHRNE